MCATRRAGLAVVALVAVLAVPGIAAAEAPPGPPFGGTAFLSPKLITNTDRSTLKRVSYVDRARREVFDRRLDRSVTIRAFVFRATYSDTTQRVRVIVNPEFGSRKAALRQARKYAREAGRMPRVLRSDLRQIWIHRGVQNFGGPERTGLLVHTGKAAEYERGGYLEEIIAHELAHASLDHRHSTTSGWRAAQASDPTFISTYARDDPAGEDVAESFIPWLAVRHLRERLDPETIALIEHAIPARLVYFDRLKPALGPLR
jgi:hypothetical protein